MKKKILTGIGFLIILAIAGGVYYEFFRNITISVELTPEQRSEYEAKVELYDQKIKTEVDEEDPLKRPRQDDFIEKARYLGYLGRLSDAERTLKADLRIYEISQVAVHNLAKLYEQMKAWSRAARSYGQLVDAYQLPEYRWDMARMEREMGNIKEAGDQYWRYQKAFRTPSAEFEQWLRDHKYRRSRKE